MYVHFVLLFVCFISDVQKYLLSYVVLKMFWE